MEETSDTHKKKKAAADDKRYRTPRPNLKVSLRKKK